MKWAKFKVFVYADSVLCLGLVEDSKEAIGRWEGQVEGLKMSLLTKNCWESMEKQVDSSGIFPIIFVISNSSRESKSFGEKEHKNIKPLRVQGPDHLHVNVQ